MTNRTHLGSGLFDFFRDLKDNNDRVWFEAHRDRYEREVREPLLGLVVDFGPRLAKISEHFLAIPKRSGGSLFPIHRDTRFSADKSPYETWAALHFRHGRADRDTHVPGFYLHLEPGQVFAGVGLWRPGAHALGRIRDAIVAQPGGWTKALSGGRFRDSFFLGGNRLSHPLGGFDPHHPLIDDLKRTDYVAVARLNEDDAAAPGFLDRYTGLCRTAAPFAEFLTRSLGFEW